MAVCCPICEWRGLLVEHGGGECEGMYSVHTSHGMAPVGWGWRGLRVGGWRGRGLTAKNKTKAVKRRVVFSTTKRSFMFMLSVFNQFHVVEDQVLNKPVKGTRLIDVVNLII